MLFRLGIAAMVLLCGLPLGAQSWEALSGLKPGDRVRVRVTGGQDVKGAFVSASGDTISVETGKGKTAIERASVEGVQTRSGARRMRNLLIGVGIGVAVGITVDQTLGVRLRNEGDASGRAVTYAAPIGIFGAIGALLPAYRTVYRAR